jgi:hypothetical protein
MSIRGYRRDPYNPTTSWPWEEDAPPGACVECAGAGVVLDVIDEERMPVTVYCQRCRMFCRSCGQWVVKEGHRCVMDRMNLWLQFFRSALAGASADVWEKPAAVAEYAAQIADAAIDAYRKRESDEVFVKGLKE